MITMGKQALVFFTVFWGLSASSPLLAGSSASLACVPVSVGTPCVKASQWDIGFHFFSAQAGVHDQAFATSIDPADRSITTTHSISPAHHTASDIDIHYHYAGGKDFQLTWMHFSDEDTGTNPNALVDAQRAIVSGFTLNTFVAELGQVITLGSAVDMRVHTGIHFIDIELHRDVTAALIGLAPLFSANPGFDAEFVGVGPRAGVDIEYRVYHLLSFVAKSSVTLFVGDSTTKGVVVGNPTGLTVPFSMKQASTLVPGASMRLGVENQFAFFNGQVRVGAGWRWEGYYQVARFFDTVGAGRDNFSMSGPYVMLRYIFDTPSLPRLTW